MFIGIPLQAAYCSAKFACRGFFEAVRAELVHEGSNVRLCMVHLPAVNTPQFDWCLTTLRPTTPSRFRPSTNPRSPARFIVDAALDGRRAKVVGSWNRGVVLAGRLTPGVVNRYAAMTGVSAQQTSEPARAERQCNLYEPVDREHDHGAHGSFGGRASGVLTPSFLRSLPRTVGIAGAAVAATLQEKVAWRRRARQRR